MIICRDIIDQALILFINYYMVIFCDIVIHGCMEKGFDLAFSAKFKLLKLW